MGAASNPKARVQAAMLGHVERVLSCGPDALLYRLHLHARVVLQLGIEALIIDGSRMRSVTHGIAELREELAGYAAFARLAPLYAWFREGFDTPDLLEAKALLEQLG